MRRILPYIFGLRALLVIVIMVAGFAGFNLRADAQEVGPPDVPTASTPTPDPTPTEPVDPGPESGTDSPGTDPNPGTQSADPEAPPCEGSTVAAGFADNPCVVSVALTETQLDQIKDGAVAFTWGLCVIVFCSIVTAIALVKGSRT